MKINTSDLKKIYRVSLQNSSFKNRLNCPSPEEIIFNVKNKFSSPSFIEHISVCPYCLDEVRLVYKIYKYDYSLVSNYKKNNSIKKLINKMSPLYLSLFALFAALLIIIPFVKNSFSPRKQRSIPNNKISLIYPQKTNLAINEIHFHWKHLENVIKYKLELFDEVLLPLLTVDEIKENYYYLSKNQLNLLKNNKNFFWMITASLSSGNSIESKLSSFKIHRYP